MDHSPFQVIDAMLLRTTSAVDLPTEVVYWSPR
jgi:hypothetical protein